MARYGNRYLRRLLVHAARSLKRVVLGRDDRLGHWLQGLDARAHANVAAVALAAKLARFCPRASADARRCADGSTALRSMGGHGPQRPLPRAGLSRLGSAYEFCSARADIATTVERRRTSLSNETALEAAAITRPAAR